MSTPVSNTVAVIAVRIIVVAVASGVVAGTLAVDHVEGMVERAGVPVGSAPLAVVHHTEPGLGPDTIIAGIAVAP